MLYEPQEDSFLIQKYVKKHAQGIVLDMGTGSGILAKEAAASPKVKKVIALDIQREIIYDRINEKHSPKIVYAVSDLFSALRKKDICFDTILFNPPYLPAEPKLKDLTLDGGKQGHEIIERFFRNVSTFLAEKGKILLVFSSLTGKKKVDSIIKKKGFNFKLLEKKHIFFEDLYLYIIKKKKS